MVSCLSLSLSSRMTAGGVDNILFINNGDPPLRHEEWFKVCILYCTMFDPLYADDSVQILYPEHLEQ